MSAPDPPPLSGALLYVATVQEPFHNFLEGYARHFRSVGWRVLGAGADCAADPAITDAFDEVRDLPLGRSLLNPSNLHPGILSTQRLIHSWGPDIVHVHTPIAAAVVRTAVRWMEKRDRPAVVYTAHGFHFFQGGHPLPNRFFAMAERAFGSWTDRLVVINDEDESAARRLRLVPEARLVRLPGVGIDEDWYASHAVDSAVASAIRNCLGLVPGRPLFVSIGELRTHKRHRRVIAGLARMRHVEAHLAIAGVGPLLEPLRREAARLGVADRVHFLGYVSDVRPLVLASEALILASSREGLSQVIMEALALEVPVIASDARGNVELIGEDAGVIVPGGEPAGIANAMDRLIAHPELRRGMGAAGRRRMLNEYRRDAVLELHALMYQQLLAERRLVGAD